MYCNYCGAELPDKATFCNQCGARLPLPAQPGPAAPDDTVATVIPYKNPKALIAYYLGVFSLIPCLAFLLGIPALVLGVMGLNFYNEYPEAKGLAHAWTGIILGGGCILLNLIALFFMLGMK